MKPILPNLWYFTGLLMGRVYLIKDSDGLTLVDTSLASAAPKILRQLKENGYAASDVKRILITHAHVDHVSGLPELKRQTDALVISSALEAPVIQGEISVPVPPSSSWLPPTVFPPTTVDQIVSEDDELPVLGGLQIVSTPGHAPGHISFWQREQRILFCGDVLMRLPKLRLPFAAFTVDMAENKRSIHKIAHLNPEVVCFGHGYPLTEEATHSLRNFAQKLLLG